MVISFWLCSLQCTCEPSKSKYFKTDFHQWNHADVKQCRYLIWNYGCQNTTSHCYQWVWSLTVCHVFDNSIAQFHCKGALFLGGLCMSLVWISKPVLLRMEEGDISLSIFYYCVCVFLCRSFNPSLPFMLLLFQGPDVACHNFTLTEPL